jgi:hypothetical protein
MKNLSVEEIKKWKLENGWYIDPDTCNRVKLGDGVKLGNRVKLGDGVKLGNRVELGDWVKLGDWVELGDWVKLGDWVELGDGVELGDWVELGDYKAIICAGRDYRGHEFIGAAINNKLHIWAGCHKEFPFKDALEHWSHNHSNELELRADILAKLEYIRLEAVRRGWEI